MLSSLTCLTEQKPEVMTDQTEAFTKADSRPLAIIVGSLFIMIIFVLLGTIFIIDIPAIYRHIRYGVKQGRKDKKAKKKNAKHNA